MPEPIVHAHTDRQLAAFVADPSHAVLLHAPQGSGKGTLADKLAAQVLEIDVQGLANYPYLHRLDAAALSSDAIDAVRKLSQFLSLKVPSAKLVSRIVIITDAHHLSIQAQNALLKTIEEPPLATLVILTAPSQASLLRTISSRLQAIAVKKPAKQALHNHFTKQGNATTDIEQAYSMSGGLPGLMTALLDGEDHPLKSATVTARELLQASMYDRLLMVEDFAKRRSHFIDVLYILQQMAHARLQVTSGSQFTRWQSILSLSYEATEQLLQNGQTKLVVDSFMLKLN